MSEVGVYPPNVKAFNAPVEQIELDDVWSKCRDDNYEFKVVIEKGFTRRQAMSSIHWQTSKVVKEIDREALNANLETWTEKKKKETFLEIVDENRKELEKQ
eukprot:11056010-Karenia_brevis.AAC.1